MTSDLPDDATAIPPAEPAALPVESVSAEAAPAMTDRQVLWEVFAVLAVGVFPPLATAITYVLHPATGQLPYWLDSAYLTARSLCAGGVILYLIHRSGETWQHFGITRPRLRDTVYGLLLVPAAYVLWLALAPLLRSEAGQTAVVFPQPQGPGDYILMVLKFASNGFVEELVTRAYLITRLERLLAARSGAVLLSALLFGSYHVYHGPAGFAFTTAFGVMFGACYLLLRRIWPFALGHMAFNVINDLDLWP